MEKLAHILKNHIGSVLSIMLVMLIIITGLTFSYRTQLKEGAISEALIANQMLEINKLKGDVLTLTSEKEKLIEQVAQTVVQYDQRIDQLNDTLKFQNDYGYQIPDYVITYLNDSGFASTSALLATLSEQDDLIPISGVLGGTMRWWPENSIVLNEKWVFGYFEDGHILGYALLHYSFDASNQLIWRVVETFVE